MSSFKRVDLKNTQCYYYNLNSKTKLMHFSVLFLLRKTIYKNYVTIKNMLLYQLLLNSKLKTLPFQISNKTKYIIPEKILWIKMKVKKKINKESIHPMQFVVFFVYLITLRNLTFLLTNQKVLVLCLCFPPNLGFQRNQNALRSNSSIIKNRRCSSNSTLL